MSGHNNVHAGLQNHSLSDIYPWSTMIRGNACVPFHCTSGELGPAFAIETAEYGDKAWALAHRQSDIWIRQRVANDDRVSMVAALRQRARKLATFEMCDYSQQLAKHFAVLASQLENASYVDNRPAEQREASVRSDAFRQLNVEQSAGPYVDGMRDIADAAGERANAFTEEDAKLLRELGL